MLVYGNSLEIMAGFPENHFDMVFADPPYFLQLEKDVYRPEGGKYQSTQDDEWDKFLSFEDYDNFTEKWLTLARRTMKKNATIWVSGSHQNIFRVGKIMQDLGFWTLNDVIWIKPNPTPNFMGVRFTGGHETFIFASKSKESKYTFNYQDLKRMNGNKQMRAEWSDLPHFQSKEQLRANGGKVHSTQKPESLLLRILRACTNEGDLILDPFGGTATTARVAKKLGWRCISIELNPFYLHHSKIRLDLTTKLLY